MEAFEFEQPAQEDHHAQADTNTVNERNLAWLVVCKQCPGGWLWKFPGELSAEDAARAHREWSEHDVEVTSR